MYSKCFISNTFLFLFGFQSWNSQNACQNSKPGRPWSDGFLRSHLIWVCTICLGIFDRQILEIYCISSPEPNTQVGCLYDNGMASGGCLFTSSKKSNSKLIQLWKISCKASSGRGRMHKAFGLNLINEPLKRQSRLQQTTNFATSFPFFNKNKVWYYMRIVCQQTKYYALFVIFEKAAKFAIVVYCKL